MRGCRRLCRFKYIYFFQWSGSGAAVALASYGVHCAAKLFDKIVFPLGVMSMFRFSRQDLRFKVDTDTRVAIVGPNGVGKSLRVCILFSASTTRQLAY